MCFAALGSGSKGNAWVVRTVRTRLMVDCGFGPREATRRLERLGLDCADIDAILVTHEHSDHGRGVAQLAARARCPVWMSHGTRRMLEAAGEAPAHCEEVFADVPFRVGDIEITPFTVPHDAREPVQFTFSDGDARFALLTDAGHVTAHMVAHLHGCHALALECNHDVGLLEAGAYPAALKRRIRGGFGHLDNVAAAALLRRLVGSHLRHVVAAHLSQENNTPELARVVLSGALGCAPEWIGVADQEAGLDWREL